MRFVHIAHDGQPAGEAAGYGRLLIRRGRTRFPVRPLTSERFLIGSGTNCHLQLGGGFPMLHSLLTREDGNWVVEAVAPEPTVYVNGAACRRRVLAAADVIVMGEFEFMLDMQGGGSGQDAETIDRRGKLASACRAEAGCLSAGELVNRLEREFRLIDRMGRTRHAAGTALLRAIERQSDDRPPRAA